MKNKIFIFLGIIAIVFFTTLFVFQQKLTPEPKVKITSIGDNKGIFVGGREFKYKESDPSKWSEATRKRVEQHKADIKAIDDAHKHRMLAYGFLKRGDLEGASKSFRVAYETEKDGATGFYLVETYEKLGRYDDAINILDDMIKNKETNEFGIQKANKIKARLLAAKEQLKS